MRRPLVYLFVRTRVNAVRRFVLGLRQPRKLFAALATLALFGFLAWSLSNSAGPRADARASAGPMLRAYLSLVLVMSVLGGFTERGIPFTPSDVDFLFPGPFRPRHLVLHHLALLAPMSVLGALLPFFFFAIHATNPALGFVGAALANLVSQHVRLFVAIASVQIDAKVFQRLRRPARLLLIGGTIALVALLVSATASEGGARAAIARYATSGVARVLLYPAVVAGDLAEATSLSDALVPLAGATAATVLSLAALLLLQVNFLEESAAASERVAARRARIRRSRNAAAAMAAERPVKAVRLPSLPVFRGAGAVAWKNLIVARRSLRTLVSSTVFLAVFFVPAILNSQRDGTWPIGMAAILPIMLASSLPFDFRGDAAHLASLRGLPVSRTALAAGEIAVPTAITVLFQGAFLGVMSALGRLPPLWALGAWIGCVPVTATMVAATNLAWLWLPRGAGAALLQVIFLGCDIAVMAGLASLLAKMGVGMWPMVAVVALGQVAFLAGLLALLGRAFHARDAEDEPV